MKDLDPDHDLDHLRGALRLVKGRGVAVDGGAHTGIWAQHLARTFQVVHAFEPVPDNLRLFRNGVVPWPVALGAQKMRAHMRPGIKNTGQWHIVNEPADDSIEVQVVDLDTIDLQALDFLKLDVEGYEFFALLGARETILRCRPAVLIEENGLCTRYGIAENMASAHLQTLGYRHAGQWNKDHLFLPQ